MVYIFGYYAILLLITTVTREVERNSNYKRTGVGAGTI